jgi:hypothetical protein
MRSRFRARVGLTAAASSWAVRSATRATRRGGISGHPQPMLSRSVLVVRTELHGAHDGEWTHLCAARSVAQPYRPSLVTPKPKVSGNESATVQQPMNTTIAGGSIMLVLQLVQVIFGARARSLATALICFVVAMGATGCTLPDTQAQPVWPTNLMRTTELRPMLGNPDNLEGIRYNQAVGLHWQRRILAHLPWYKILRSNGKHFPSPERARRIGIKYVIPDGVTGACEGMPSPLPPVTFTDPESTFVEVKALNGVLNLDYGRHQIRGMLDALSQSPAASSTGPRRAYPSLYLIITEDTALGSDIERRGTALNVLVWVSWVQKLWTGQLQVTAPLCLNCASILPDKSTPLTAPGPSFSLGELGKPGSGGLDEPILDDKLVGFPGAPGDTSPNP